MLRRLLVPFLLTGLVLIAFSRLYGAEFTPLDDFGTIAYNKTFLHLNADAFRSVWTEPAGQLYIPVTYSLWWLMVYFGPSSSVPGPTTDPMLFHVANVIVHIGSTLVVYSLLARYFPKKRWAVFVGAAVFALHPLQAEAVGWTSGFKDVLYGFFTLLAVRLYLSATAGMVDATPEPRNASGTYKRPVYWCGVLSFCVAMLCKPTAMITPVLALALDVTLNHRHWRPALATIWPWFVLAVPCAIWTKYFQDYPYPVGVPLWGRPLIAADACAYYIAKIVLPYNLSIDPGRRPDWTWASGAPFYTWLLPATVAVFIVVFRKRWRWLPAAGLAMLIPLLPVSGLVAFAYQNFTTVAGHYMYVATFGVAIAVTGVLSTTQKPLLRAASLIVLVMLALRTVVETGYWHDGETLFTRMYEVNPRSYLALDLAGHVFLLENKYDIAEHNFRQAIEINPEYAPPYRGLGDMLLRLGNANLDRDKIEEGVDLLRRAIEIRKTSGPRMRPEDSPARLVIGRIYVSLGRTEDARTQFSQIISANTDPDSVKQAKEELEKLASAKNVTAPSTSGPLTTPATVPALEDVVPGA